MVAVLQNSVEKHVKKRPATALSDSEGEKKRSADPGGYEQPPAYPGVSQRPPIYWGGCTIYTSARASKWRVKLRKGDYLDHGVPFTARPQEAWGSVIKM